MSVQKRRFAILWFFTLFLLFFTSVHLDADEEAVAGKKVLKNWQNSVVTLKVVLKTRISMGGREMSKNEGKSEVSATVIDPSGLIVFSLLASDPTEMFKKFMSSGESDQFKIDMGSEITSLTMRLADGKEIPVTIVLRDKDLDLVFALPTTKVSQPLFNLNLSQNASADVLEPVVLLNRMGKEGMWVPAVLLDRIQAIVKKPRTFYVPGGTVGEGTSGCPVFNLSGKVIGILVLRMPPSEGRPQTGIGTAFGAGGVGVIRVILPAEDVIEVAKQIPLPK